MSHDQSPNFTAAASWLCAACSRRPDNLACALVVLNDALMERTRLQTVAPDLDKAIAAAPAEVASSAAWAAARWAVEQVGLSHPAIAEALSGTCVGKVPALAARLDKEYFALDNDGRAPEATVLDVFSKARAASAVEFAARGEAAEAIYEAIIATDDIASVRSVVLSALRPSS
jgi:hypothetical protein